MLLVKERLALDENRFVEFVVWKVPVSVPGSDHGFKYRLAFVVDEVCVVRFENETGKGDPRQLGEVEDIYAFTDLDSLFEDFRRAVADWRAS